MSKPNNNFTKQELNLIGAMFFRVEISTIKNFLPKQMENLSIEELQRIRSSANHKCQIKMMVKCPHCKNKVVELLSVKNKNYCFLCKPRKLDAWRKKNIREAIENSRVVKNEFPKAWGKIVRFTVQLGRQEQEYKGINWISAFGGTSISRIKSESPDKIIASAIKAFPELCTREPIPVTNEDIFEK